MFCNQRFVAVFDHVLGPCVVHDFGDERPLLAVFEHVPKEILILQDSPISLILTGIEVVVPSFAALLSSSKESLF